MADLFDYLKWRGDISFSQVPVTPVDALIFSTLSYVCFDGIVPEAGKVGLVQAAQAVQAGPVPEQNQKRRHQELLYAAAQTRRFADVALGNWKNVLLPEEEIQFAAVCFYLTDGSVYIAYRGTDSTLVGWKEDFNMSFRDTVPAQLMAERYARQVASQTAAPLRLGGHSKGGNLAVYAAAKVPEAAQERIVEVYNQDGPGFSAEMMADPGYLRIVPKVRTYVPQSSVIGMLLEHEEDLTIIRSNQIGILQHDPYSWEVLGGGFITLEELTGNSQFLDRTLKGWLGSMTVEERNRFVDTVYSLLTAGDASHVREILRPQNLAAYVRTLREDEAMRKVIGAELSGLLQAAREAQRKEE